MKKLIFLILLLAIQPAFCGMRNTIKQRPTSMWWHTGKDYTTDPGRQWAYEVEDRIAGPMGTAKIWYVDASATGQASALNWADAETSLDDVFALINSDNGDGRGDFIYIAQDTELNPTASITVDAACVSIVGVGNGDDIPSIVFNDATVQLQVTASNTLFYNIRLKANTPTITECFSIEDSADYTTIANCIFPAPATKTASLTSCFVDAIDLEDGADGFRALGVEFYNTEATGTSYFIDAGNGANNDMVVADSVLMAEFAVAAIFSDVAASRTTISNNTIMNLTTGQHCIEFSNPTTGMCTGNWMYGDTRGSVLDPGSMYCVENYVTYIIDQSAELVPPAIGQKSFLVGNWNYTVDGHIPLTTTLGSTIFSVTGDIEGYCYGICASSVTAQIGSENYIQLGTIASPTMILHTITPSQELTTGDIWYGATLATETASFNPNTANHFVICDGRDIILTCASLTAITGGNIDFYLTWVGMSTDSMVTAR